MSIMTRFVRLCKADIHGVMDQLEDKELLLRQYIRDMEEELAGKEIKLKKMKASRDSAKHEHEKYSLDIDNLEKDLGVAIEKDKDDIARFIIRKQKPLTAHRNELGNHIKNLDLEITQFQECVDEQRLQYEQLQLKSAEYFRKAEREQWNKTMSSDIPNNASRELAEEEVELELIRRKEALQGGDRK